MERACPGDVQAEAVQSDFSAEETKKIMSPKNILSALPCSVSHPFELWFNPIGACYKL